MTEGRQEMKRMFGLRPQMRVGIRWRLRGAALGAMFALVVAPGCQGQGRSVPVVLTVGPREIRSDELERAFWAECQSNKTFFPDSSSLRRFLPVYVDKVIGQELARQAVPVLEGAQKEMIEGAKETLIVDALRREAYLDAAEPSTAELKKSYGELGRELHLRRIALADRQEAEDLLAVLRQGGAFAKIAAQKSLDTNSRDSGGDIGWVTYYRVDGEPRERIWVLKSGEMTEPLAVAGQWQIFQLVEERPNVGRGTLEAETPQLRAGLMAGRATAGSRRYLDELLRKYEFKTDPAEVAWMTALLREKTASVPRDIGGFDPGELETPEVKEQISGNPFKTPPVAPADTGRVLATWNAPGGRVTPYLVIDQLLIDAPIAWPRFEVSDDVTKLIRSIVIERLEIAEALARKIDQRPEILAQIAEREREIRSRFFFRTKIRPEAALTDSQVRSYYDSHPAEFRQGERRRFVAISAADSGLAREIQSLLREGLKVSEVRKRFLGRDPSLASSGDRGTDLMTYGQSPLLDNVIFALPKDGVSEPIAVGGRWTVARVVEILPERTVPFEEAMLGIRSRSAGARADSLLKVKIDEVRPGYPVQLHEEALRRVRFRAPAGS
jgi:peptidyl-prolyl cis-trans isomerase C